MVFKGKREQSGKPRRIEVIGLSVAVVTAIAALVPIYTGLITEPNARLGLRYLSSQALINLEPTRTANVDVSVNGTRVGFPWLVSVRVENTGNVPIESTEVRDPLTLSFGEARVVRSTIADKSPAEMRVSTQDTDHGLTSTFDLLNPGDFFNADILLDGHPDQIAHSFRMRGKYLVTEFQATQRDSTAYVTLPRLPKAIEWSALAVSSLGALGLTMIGGIVFGIGMRALLVRAAPKIFARGAIARARAASGDILIEDVLRNLQPFGRFAFGTKLTAMVPQLNGIAGMEFVLPHAQGLRAEIADSQEGLENALRNLVANEQVQSGEIDLPACARAICELVRENFGQTVAGHTYGVLPTPLDRAVNKRIRDLPKDLSLPAVRERVRDILSDDEISEDITLIGEDFLPPLLGGIIALAMGLSAVVVLSGSWHTAYFG